MRAAGRLRLAMVTNIPAPYRVPVCNLLANEPDIDFRVIYAARAEPDRHWDLPPLDHEHEFLAGRLVERDGRFIHYNTDVWGSLARFSPHVIITTGYNPTHLMAVAYARLNGAAHVVMTDGTHASEARLTALHRLVRRVVFALSSSFVVASHGGYRLLRGFGVKSDRIHFSPLCTNTAADWSPQVGRTRDIDLLFSGRLVPVKNASFALKVAEGVAARLGRPVTMVVLGSGPLEAQLRAEAQALAPRVQVHFAGYVSQNELPGWYQRSRLFLFPTLWDPWGVVANEAAQAGVPVLVSPNAGAAGEIVRDGLNGLILPLDLDLWIDRSTRLLQDPKLYQRMHEAGPACVADYSAVNAAAGMADAACQAARRTTAARNRFVRRPRVVCVQKRLTHYRVALFEALRDRLDANNIEFVLVHGMPSPKEQKKNDSGQLPWARVVPTRYLAGGQAVWQPLHDELVGADLVIVPQENSHLYNLLLFSIRRPPRLAYWGHGQNFQAQAHHKLSEAFKALLVNRVDWWFSYTDRTTKLLRERGVADERITTLDNAVDTSSLAQQFDAIRPDEVQQWREEHHLGTGPIGLFVGSLYPDKRIGFLLECAQAIAKQVPDFRLVVVGAGPDQDLVTAAAGSQPWVRFLGARFGREKALCLRAAQLMLNPGLVGLGILDSFVAGLPLVTTDCDLHSPEIEYLRHGENGLMTPDSPQAFVEATVMLLTQAEQRDRLSAGCRRDASTYTIEHMAYNFAEGIERALQLPAA